MNNADYGLSLQKMICDEYGIEINDWAKAQFDADAYAIEIKKMYSMWFSRKYSERKILRRIEAKALYLDSDWYVRNVLAYIPRNAIDNGFNVNEYKWSGYQAAFQKGELEPQASKPVKLLKSRDKERIMHTGEKLDRVPWLIDSDGCLMMAVAHSGPS